MIKVLLSFFLLIGISVASEITQEDVKTTIKQIKNIKPNKEVNETVQKAQKQIKDKKAQKEAEETIKQFHKNMDRLVEEWKKRIDYDEKTGKLTIKGEVKDNLKPGGDIQIKDIQIGTGENKFLSRKDRIYIFISSSIPKHILIEYAKQIVDLGLENRAVMVLRGCIGGCKYIKPTLKWISSILHEEGKNKNGLPVAIWIDPLLFRMYKINQVPCVVFAEKVNVFQPELSEGLKYNLRNIPEAAISCGDWSLEYHLKKLYERTKNKKLKAIILGVKRKGFFHR